MGRTTLDGSFTEFSIPTSGSGPHSITVGPDGNLWLAEFAVNQIGRLTPRGSITEYSIPTPNTSPFYIISGPDGNLWFTEWYLNTFPGENVGVSLSSGTTLTFANVTNAGETTVTSSNNGPTPPSGFTLGDQSTFYDIKTTAT